MYERFIKNQVEEALSDTPVVFIQGPRQVGKTTFVKQIKTEEWEYVTLDDESNLEFATGDSVGFLRGRDRLIIDEVQRAPNLLLGIKKSVDEDRRPGRFILTGSANVLLMPRISDSLAGRIETIDMLPLSQSEIIGLKPTFLDSLFSGKMNCNPTKVSFDEIIQTVVRGGYPESIARKNEKSSLRWGKNLLNAMINRDLRELSEINNLGDMSTFVEALALNSGQLVNFTQLGNSINVNYKTGQRYTALLEMLFLTRRLRPWHSNKTKQLVKSPKLHFLDTGLLVAARGLNFNKLRENRTDLGQVLECFVFSEVLKLMQESEHDFKSYFFRGANSKEVDIVLERDDGMIAGIEVKSSATIHYKDFAGLQELAKLCGKKFAFGVVLCANSEVTLFGDRLATIPVSSLWS